MTISMFQASIPVYLQYLNATSAVLDKGAAFAEAKKIDPAVLLQTRLYPDMFPLVRQCRSSPTRRCAAPRGWPASSRRPFPTPRRASPS